MKTTFLSKPALSKIPLSFTLVLFLLSSLSFFFVILISKMSIYTLVSPSNWFEGLLDFISYIGDESNNPIPFFVKTWDVVVNFLVDIHTITWVVLALPVINHLISLRSRGKMEVDKSSVKMSLNVQ